MAIFSDNCILDLENGNDRGRSLGARNELVKAGLALNSRVAYIIGNCSFSFSSLKPCALGPAAFLQDWKRTLVMCVNDEADVEIRADYQEQPPRPV